MENQMDDMEEVKKVMDLALECGFTHVGPLDADTIYLNPQIREQCAMDTCHAYNTSWSCPPGIGTLEECEAQIRKFHHGIIMQTGGELEDSFDFETMDELNEKHRDNVHLFTDEVRKIYPESLILGDGCCVRCKKCTYPDAPCRFPEKMTTSMEAFGIFVSELCTKNNIPYYYGPNTMTYVACMLFK